MNRLTAIGLASLVAYGVLLATLWDGSPASSAAGARAAAGDPAVPVPVSAPLATAREPAARPQYAASTRHAVAPSSARRLSGVAQEFRQSRDLKAFVDSLLARKDSLNHEERYYLARALETCAFATSMNDDLAVAAEKRRRQFLATLPPAAPAAAKRIAAYDAADDTRRCIGFQGSRIAQKQVDDLYREASEGGDARAQARMLVAELNKNLTTSKGGEPGKPVGNEDFQRIIGLLETRDAEAMVLVAQFLAQHQLIGELRLGTTGEVPEPASLVGAFSLVACDFQPTCSTFDRESLQACAYAGYCNAGSYEELYANFLASPWSYAQALRYRDIIHSAIETHNWSLLGLQKLIGAKSNAAR
ncbi:MAG: hypothetical protein FIB05_03510 [Betaproteobacteria bacterium]|nr:hypothetical protein [Betaproteobacteria bacterium]